MLIYLLHRYHIDVTLDMKKSINSVALSIAHSIKSNFITFSQALKAAWKIAKIFCGWPTAIRFVKDGGEVREAMAIACSSLKTLDQGFLRFVEALPNGRTQWRSFRIDRLF